jgi:hypothetical protein
MATQVLSDGASGANAILWPLGEPRAVIRFEAEPMEFVGRSERWKLV